jgi:ribokinase
LVVRVRRVPDAGETVTGTGFGIYGGGKGANQSIAAARSGADVTMLGAVGEDEFGGQRLADLEAERIDLAGVLRSRDAPSGVALITVEDSGENRIAYVPGATGMVTAEHVRRTVERVRPGTILATLELPVEALEALFRASREMQARMVLNATPEPGRHLAFVAAADTLIVNESEAREILGWTSAQSDWEAAAVRLAALGPADVVITLGSSGALVYDGDGAHLIPAPHVHVLDTTGAGDAFCGVFAARVNSGESLHQAARAGVVAGSLAVTLEGAQPSQPTHDQIEAAIHGIERG